MAPLPGKITERIRESDPEAVGSARRADVRVEWGRVRGFWRTGLDLANGGWRESKADLSGGGWTFFQIKNPSFSHSFQERQRIFMEKTG
jgi:hypothetical protein